MSKLSKFPKHRFTFVLLCLLLNACNQTGTKKEGPHTKEVGFESFAKSDIGVVMEIHVEETRTCL